MKNIKSIALTLGLGMSLLTGLDAHSQVTKADGTCTSCGAPPASEVAPSPFSANSAKTMFENGTKPGMKDLVGSWKLISFTASYYTSYNRESVAEPSPGVGFYDKNGFQDLYGNPTGTLIVRPGGNTGETTFSGDPIIAPPSIEPSGGQGPGELSLDDNDRVACFSQNTYGYRDAFGYLNGMYAFETIGYQGQQPPMQRQTYLTSKCRLLAGNSEKLVCAVTLHVAQFDKTPSCMISEYNDEDLILQDGTVVFYSGYVKE